MANYNELKAQIDAAITTNDNQEITGAVLRNILKSRMVEALGAKYQFAGVATPYTNPGTPDYNVAYLAATPGLYTYFGGIIITSNQICALKYNGSWTKEVLIELTPPQMTPYDNHSYIPEGDWPGDTLPLEIINLPRGITDIDVPVDAVDPEVHIDDTDISNVDNCEFVLRIFNGSSVDCFGPENVAGSGGTIIPPDHWGYYQFAVVSHSLYLISFSVL